MAFDVGAVVGRLELGLEGWKKSVETIKADQQSLAGFAIRHKDEIEKLGKQFTVAGAVITGALSAIILHTVEVEHEFAHLSEKTGISVGDLSSMSLAAKKGGTSIEELTRGLKFLATQMIETSTATDKSKTVLGALKIEATDATGKLRPFSDILPEIADKFKGMEDGALKVKLAVALFGRSAIDMIPMLNMGSEGFKKNAEMAERFGTKLSESTVKAAEEFKESMINLQAASTGLEHTLGEALMPTVKKFVDHATDAIVKVKDWAKENPGLTKGVLEFAGGLGVSLTVAGTLLVTIGTLVRNLQILRIAVSTPILITVGIVGGYALSRAFEEMRDFYEKNVSHKFVSEQDQDWQALIRTMGEWTPIANEIAEGYQKQNKYSKESGTIVGKLDDIWQKYGNSSRRAMEAILKGEVGPAVKKLLLDLMEAHGGAAQAASVLGKATEDVTKKSKALDPVLKALLDVLDKSGAATKTLAEETGILTRIELERKLQQYKSALVQYRDSMPIAEQEKLKKQIRETEDQLKSIYDTTMKAALGFNHTADDVDLFGTALKKLGPIANAAEMTADAFGDMTIEITRKMAEVPKVVKEKTSEVSTIMTNFVQDLSRDLVGILNLDEIFGLKGLTKSFDDMRRRNEVYFKRALDEAEAFFDAQEKQYDKALDDIRDYYDEVEKASRKRYDDERDLVGEQYDAVLKTARREYEDKRDWIEENVKDETTRKIQLKALDREYEDYVDKLKKEEKDKLKAMEEAHQADLDKLRADQKAKEDQLKADLVKLEEDKKKEMDRIRADEDKARDELAKREEERQGSLWTRIKDSFGKVCGDMLRLAVSTFLQPVGDAISGLIKRLIGKGEDSVNGALDGVGKTTENLGKTIGDFISGIGQGIGGFISGLATGIATAITTLATAIATAATTLAAAAPAIIAVGAIALGIFAGFKLIESIFSGGASGKQTDVTYWLKMIKDNSQILVNFISGNYLDLVTRMTSKIESLHDDKFGALLDQQYLQTDYQRQIAESTRGTWDILGKVNFAASGVNTIVSRPTMFMAGEGGRSERVTVTPNTPASNVPIYITVQSVLDGKVIATSVAKHMPEMSRTRRMKFYEEGIIYR